MKRILAIALVTGLVAIPSLVSAQHGADDTSTTNNVRREDRRQDRSAATASAPTTAATATQSNVTVPNQTTSVKVEADGLSADAGVTVDAAIAQAQTVFPGKTVVKVELEHEQGILVYSVRFSDGSRVDVDATTGTVVSSRDFTDHDNRDNEHRQSGNDGHGSDDSSSNHNGSVRNHSEDD